MPGIASLLPGDYYSLDNRSSGNNPAQVIQSTGLPKLTGNFSAGAAAESAYALDLSPDALTYIKSINGHSAGAPGYYSSVTNFTLSRDQRQTIDAIIARYRDAPFTQETFSRIQNDLKDAGLSPETLALQDSARNFNPTKFLLDALNGTSGSDLALDSLTGKPSAGDSSGKSVNFMTGVADSWARISSTLGNKQAASASILI